NCSRIEFRHRKIERLRIALDFGLVRLADVDQQDLAFGEPPRHLLRGQIVHVLSAKLSGHGTYSSIRRGGAALQNKSRVTIRESRPTGFAARWHQIVTCVPTSTTRPVGI